MGSIKLVNYFITRVKLSKIIFVNYCLWETQTKRTHIPRTRNV
jgi:hypothetical protein